MYEQDDIESIYQSQMSNETWCVVFFNDGKIYWSDRNTWYI